MLTLQTSSECVHCVGFRWPKTAILGKFWHFRSSCTDPLLPTRVKFGVLEQTQSVHLPAKFHLNVFIVSATASGDQKPQFWANFDTFGRSFRPTDPLIPMRAKFGVLEQTQGLHLPAKFHLNVFIVSASSGQKPQNHNFGQILTFWGAPVSTPFHWWGPNLVCYSRPAVYAYTPNFVSIGLLCRPLAAKNVKFCHFWT